MPGAERAVTVQAPDTPAPGDNQEGWLEGTVAHRKAWQDRWVPGPTPTRLQTWVSVTARGSVAEVGQRTTGNHNQDPCPNGADQRILWPGRGLAHDSKRATCDMVGAVPPYLLTWCLSQPAVPTHEPSALGPGLTVTSPLLETHVHVGTLLPWTAAARGTLLFQAVTPEATRCQGEKGRVAAGLPPGLRASPLWHS